MVKYKRLRSLLENCSGREGKKRNNRGDRLIAAVRSWGMVQTVCPPQAMALAESEVKEAAEYLEIDQLFSATQSAVTTDSPENVETQTSAALFQDGAVRIYHALQLYAIGSNAVVHSGDAQAETFGTGTVLTDDNGQVLLYDSDGSYQLMNDIALPDGTAWTLPSGFSGTFVSEVESTEAPLYDEDTDTIYIYNNYQLLTRAAEDELKTVLSGDNVAETFGLGQMVYAGDQQLEYTQDHNYVVSQSFTGEMPELKAEEVLQEGTSWDGRQYEGQVIYYEKDVQYILIGNKQQLQAIGKTDKNGDPIKVTEPVWAQKQEAYSVGGIGYWRDVGDPIEYYRGDADIISNGDYTELFSFDQEVGGTGEYEGSILGKDTRNKYYGSMLNGAEVVCNKNADKYHTNIERGHGDDFEPVYSTIANYIIFRPISLKGVNWTPLMFSGTMEGRLNMKNGEKIIISNVNIKATGELDPRVSMGVGFFATISSERNENDIGLVGSQAVVKNIHLDQINVENGYTGMADTETLVSGLLKVLGGILGWIAGIVGDLVNAVIPGSNLKLGDFLRELLSVKKESPDTFATGAFAGRMIGDVLVEGCSVTNASVSSSHDMTGGFVGNVEGVTEYDGLSDKLGKTVETLEEVLNLIPGLGLGDLITVVLDNPTLLNVKELIPTGYKSATIQDCDIQLSNGAIGMETTSFNGGFAGCQTGAKVSECTVTGLSQVNAFQYAGGFAGVIRDAVMLGLLDKVGVNLSDEVIAKLRGVDPSSENVDCSVAGDNWSVSSGEYAGGFTGIAANSDLSKITVSGLKNVTVSVKTYMNESTT